MWYPANFARVIRVSVDSPNIRAFAKHTCPRDATDAANICDELPDGWQKAKPYDSIPGPSKFRLMRLFAPGGQLYGAAPLRIQRYLNDNYGPLVRLPGVLRQRDRIFTFVPEHFEEVFRNEGPWPIRRNFDSFEYYRKHIRPDVFRGSGGLAGEQGEAWLRMRQAVNPLFMSTQKWATYMPDMDRIARDFVQRVGASLDRETSETPADFGNELSLWALESAMLAALDRRLGVLSANRTPEIDRLIVAVRDFFRLVYELEVNISFWRYFTTTQLREFFKALDVVTNFNAKYINQPSSEEDIGSEKHSVMKQLQEKDPIYALLMSFDMIFAGVDTTAGGMSIFMYYLAINPGHQEKLHQELLRLLPNRESPVTPKLLEQCVYLRACLKESMRLQPLAPVSLRAAGKNMILDGYRIPKMTDVYMAHNLLQMNENHFTDNTKFVPERWLRSSPEYEADAKKRQPFVFLPFGFGARACIGKRLAEMELHTLAVRLLREFRIEWHHGPLEYENSIVVKPKNDLKFKLIPI